MLLSMEEGETEFISTEWLVAVWVYVLRVLRPCPDSMEEVPRVAMSKGTGTVKPESKRGLVWTVVCRPDTHYSPCPSAKS